MPFVLLHAVPLSFDTAGWGTLFQRDERPSARMLYWIRWTSESVNNLLPVAQVGGELLRANLVARAGVPKEDAGATVVVDVTGGLVCQILLSLFALIVLVFEQQTVRGLWIGFAVFVLAIGAFLLAQRRGMFALAFRQAARLLGNLEPRDWSGGAERLDGAIGGLYGDRRALLLNIGLRLLGRLACGFEVFVGLHLLGAHVGLLDAVVLQSLVSLVRSAAFAIPGGLGAQEGGLVLVGGLLGIPPEIALALGLMRRVREVAFGVPGLIAWPILLQKTRRGSSGHYSESET